MDPIIDLHTHAQDVQNEPTVRPYVRGLAAFMAWPGPIWAWELLNFHPKLAARARGPLSTWTAFESQMRLSRATPKRLVSAMKKAGVARAVIHPVEPLSCAEEALAIARDNPSLIPFAAADPRDAHAAEKLDKLLAAGAKGVKCHPILQQTAPEDSAWRPLLEVAQARGVPVLFHAGAFQYHLFPRPSHQYGCPRRFETLLKAFPKADIVLGHMGLHESDDAIALAQRFNNVILETSFQHHSIIRRAFNAVGAERLAFGSDWPATDIASALRQVRNALSDDANLEKVLWQNAQRLLGLQN
jgi:predicted TIM-barrel fold metal-dependent hydrolase